MSSEFTELLNLHDIEIGRRDRRPICDKCNRPEVVCWCRNLTSKLNISCKIIVLQHPSEEKRCLRTAPILQKLLPESNLVILKGKKFNQLRRTSVLNILDNINSLLLYPSPEATDILDVPTISAENLTYNIVILDGTWQQAKAMYHLNPFLKKLRAVKVNTESKQSQYVIRTQPTEKSLSTVEAAAFVLATLEKNDAIYDTLVAPLKLMCQYQMDHGAVKHDSKEYLILTGKYEKPLGKRTLKKVRRNLDNKVLENSENKDDIQNADQKL